MSQEQRPRQVGLRRREAVHVARLVADDDRALIAGEDGRRAAPRQPPATRPEDAQVRRGGAAATRQLRRCVPGEASRASCFHSHQHFG